MCSGSKGLKIEPHLYLHIPSESQLKAAVLTLPDLPPLCYCLAEEVTPWAHLSHKAVEIVILYLLKGLFDVPHSSLQRELCCTTDGRRAWFSQDVPIPTARVLWGALQPSIINFLLCPVMIWASSNPLQRAQAPSGGKEMPWRRKRRSKQFSPAGNFDLAPSLVLVYRHQ